MSLLEKNDIGRHYIQKQKSSKCKNHIQFDIYQRNVLKNIHNNRKKSYRILIKKPSDIQRITLLQRNMIKLKIVYNLRQH